MQNDQLVHYGVKGMKWGVRRNLKSASNTLSKSDQSILSDRQLRNLQRNRKKLESELKKMETRKEVKRRLKRSQILSQSISDIDDILVENGKRETKQLDMMDTVLSDIEFRKLVDPYGFFDSFE